MNLNEFKDYAKQPKKVTTARNIMGCSESFYDPCYLAYKALGDKEIDKLSDREYELIMKVADFATEVFY